MPRPSSQFRLAHPDWPAQDELREKAETVLFLTDASPDEVRAFFKNSAPLTGAGKAALAGVNIKDGDEAGAKALVVSAWRDHQLNAAVEKKILDRYGNMLTAETFIARASTGCSIRTIRPPPRRRCACPSCCPPTSRRRSRRASPW